MMDLYQEIWKSKKETREDFCQCGSCMKHWRNYIMMPLTMFSCSVKGCTNKATVGGHIVSENYPEGYIVPLCDQCNQSDEHFSVYTNSIFVSADLSITCQKGKESTSDKKNKNLSDKNTANQGGEKAFANDNFNELDDIDKLQVLTGCECKTYDCSVESYFRYREQGKKEGFIPVIVATDEIYFEQLEIALRCDGETSISKIREIVEAYHQKMLTAPVEDGKAYFEKNHISAQWDDDEFNDDEEYEEEGYFAKNGYIVIVPVTDPWRIWAYLPYGGWNACPNVSEHMAVSKYWYEQYGAYPAALSYDTIDYAVEEIPEDLEKLANEVGTYCFDIVEQGCETYSALAAGLKNSRIWNLWWD